MLNNNFLDGWLSGDALTAWKTVRARVESGVVISPALGLEILDAMDKLAGDVTAAVGDRMRAEGEAQILAIWLANRELGIPLADQGCDADGGMSAPAPALLREAARRVAEEEMEARHD